MALFKTSPAIEVRVPRIITPGDRFRAELCLRAKEEVAVEYARLELTCRAGWTVGAGKSRVSRYDEPIRMRASVFEGPVLAKGEHVFHAMFDLPAELPPSHEGGAASVRWVLEAEVSIPWWPDARSRHPLLITSRASGGHSAAPSSFRQGVRHAGQPRIEASLSSTIVAPGGVISGGFALHDFDESKDLSVRIGLVERDTLVSRAGVERVRDGRAWSVQTTSPRGSHARGQTFEFRLPETLAPTFSCAAFAHSYLLEVVVKTGLLAHSSLRVPVTVVNDVALRDESLRLLPPSVGATRMAELGRAVAAQRGYTLEGGALQRTLASGDVSVAIALSHEHREGQGTMLVGGLRFPRLGLALTVEPQGRLRALFARDPEIGDPDWDRAHRVTAREGAQATVFLRALVDSLGTKDAGLAWLDDETAKVEVPDPAMSAASLDAFAARVERIAIAIAEASALIPPPSGVVVEDGWTQLARRLRGRLVAGDLSIEDGQLGATGVEIVTRWTEDPAHLVTLTPDPPLPDEVSLALAKPAEDVAHEPTLPRDVIALLARLPASCASLSLSGGQIRVEVALRSGDGAVSLRPDDVQTTIDLLARLGPLFAVRRGPFR